MSFINVYDLPSDKLLTFNAQSKSSNKEQIIAHCFLKKKYSVRVIYLCQTTTLEALN